MERRKIILFISWLVFACSSGIAQTSPPSEYQLKAAFIYNFAKFVDWPPESFAGDNSPFVIGVLGENPFGENLKQTIAGKEINSRPIMLKPLRSVADAARCHLIFISNSMAAQLPEIFKSLAGSAVLTVGESENFIQSGGIIRFVDDAKKVRFQINAEAAKAARMKISSRLLTLSLPLN